MNMSELGRIFIGISSQFASFFPPYLPLTVWIVCGFDNFGIVVFANVTIENECYFSQSCYFQLFLQRLLQ